MTISPWNRDEDYYTVVKSEKGSNDIVERIGLLGWFEFPNGCISDSRKVLKRGAIYRLWESLSLVGFRLRRFTLAIIGV